MLSGGRTQTGYTEKFTAWGPPDGNPKRNRQNYAETNDPVVNDAVNAIWAVYGDYDARAKLMQELERYVVEQAYYITFPTPAEYAVYQPWLKNNYGQYGMGYRSNHNWTIFAWIDQELKKEMGY